jgi:hypothetical protein
VLEFCLLRAKFANLGFGEEMSSCYMIKFVIVLLYRIAGKVGGEFTLADWRFLCPPPKYNLLNISLKKPNLLLYVYP